MKTMKRSLLPPVVLAAGVMITTGVLAPRADAGLTYPVENAGQDWKWGVTLDYTLREVDRTETYLSEGMPPRDWSVTYDAYDANMWGFTIFVTPPCFANTMIDFSYRTGDLEGKFKNRALDPASMYYGESFAGRADFDRDEFEVGVTYPFPNMSWLYARAEWFWAEEDGDWDYGEGEIETQEYDMWGITAGMGAMQEFTFGASDVTLVLNAFAGLVYFDLEHTETTDPANHLTTAWSGWAYQGRVGARLAYPVQEGTDVFLGVGYEILEADDSGLDMTTDGFFANLGVMGEW
jgi:hypothetical protein